MCRWMRPIPRLRATSAKRARTSSGGTSNYIGTTSSRRGVEHGPAFAAFRFRRRLALHAHAGPGHGIQALGRDRLFAALTLAVGAFPDPHQRGSNLVDRMRLLVQGFDRHVAVRAQPDL